MVGEEVIHLLGSSHFWLSVFHDKDVYHHISDMTVFLERFLLEIDGFFPHNKEIFFCFWIIGVRPEAI